MKNTHLNTLLRKASMKATPGHVRILSLFATSKKPMSSQDVIARIGTGLDQATVYRCIAKLKEAGLIYQVDLRQNHAQYEFFDMTHHHHIVCVKCGKIEDVSDCHLEDMNERILKYAQQFQEVTHHSLEFYGVCRKCFQQKTAN